jgi:signal transduction histidine kinase
MLIGFSSFVLVSFLLVVSTTLWDKRSQAIAEAARTRQNLTRTLEQYVIGQVRVIELVLDGLANGLDAERSREPLDLDRAQALLAAQMHPDSVYHDLVVYDADGNRLINAVGDTGPFNAGERDYFTALRDRPDVDFHISRPFLSTVTKVWSLGFTRRLRKPDGSFGGVVLATLDLDRIEGFFAFLDVGRDGNITLWDGTASRVFARFPVNQSLLGRAFEEGPLYERIRAGRGEGAFQSVSPLDHIERMLSFRRIADLPLVISVAQAEYEVLAEWRKELWTYGIASAAGVAILLLLTAGLWWQLARQERLVRALRGSEAAMRQTNQSLRTAIVAAEAASRTKSEFLACMSHELRTPLNAVIGFAELISRGTQQDPAKISGYAQHILQSGENLLRIITDILEMSRLQGGMLELDEEALDIAGVIATALRQLEPRARQGGIALRSAAGGSLPILRGDEKRMTQVLFNLLANGIKFTKPGGAVSLNAALTPDGDLAITVADSGIGMTEAELALAMEPFRQADSNLARRYDGAGLGLPLAKALVELHGGQLTLASTPGSGTTARIVLPRDRFVPRPVAVAIAG